MICGITFNYYFYFVFIMSVWQFVLVTATVAPNQPYTISCQSFNYKKGKKIN